MWYFFLTKCWLKWVVLKPLGQPKLRWEVRVKEDAENVKPRVDKNEVSMEKENCK